MGTAVHLSTVASLQRSCPTRSALLPRKELSGSRSSVQQSRVKDPLKGNSFVAIPQVRISFSRIALSPEGAAPRAPGVEMFSDVEFCRDAWAAAASQLKTVGILDTWPAGREESDTELPTPGERSQKLWLTAEIYSLNHRYHPVRSG